MAIPVTKDDSMWKCSHDVGVRGRETVNLAEGWCHESGLEELTLEG